MVLWRSSSTSLRDDRMHGCSACEIQILDGQYLQLTGTHGPRGVGQERGEAKIASGWPPAFDGLSRHSLTPGSPMTANRVQASLSQQLAASTTSRRRSVPPSPPEPMSQSLNQRWRERPRCPTSPVTPDRRDGVVHAIVGRAACHCLRAQFVQDERAARVHVFVSRFAGTRRTLSRTEIGSRACASVQEEASRLRIQILLPHHRAFHAGAVLGVVNALRFASTRPTAGPSGIDDASARHMSGSYAMVANMMTARTKLTRESRRRMLASSRQCRTALPPFAPRANGARIRSAPSGHGIERNPQHIAVRCTTTENGRSARL